MNEPIFTEQEGNVLQIILNRPEAYNALNLDMMNLLAEGRVPWPPGKCG